MDQGAFDFEDFNKRVQEQRDKEYAEARSGRDVLQAKLDEAVSKRDELDDEIAGLEEQIGVIDKFLGEEESSAPRDSGVKRTIETIATSIDGWSLDEIASAVREYKPRVKVSSVRSALARLVKDGVLSVDGARGEKRWSYIPKPLPDDEKKPAMVHTGEAKVETTDLPPSPEQAPAGEPAPAPPRAKAEDEILSELHRRISEAAAKNDDGVDSKTLAWIMADVGATSEQFELAVKRLVDAGVVEDGVALTEDGGHVLRKPAEPGSKEDLKRTQVQGRMAFPGMDKPPHL
jgi:hypothetical protein